MDDEENFQVEYKHYLEKWNGYNWEKVAEDTKPDLFVNPKEQNHFTVASGASLDDTEVRTRKAQDGENWSNQRGCDVEGSPGDRFKLDCYTEITPPHGDGRSPIKASKVREFTV